MFRVYTLALSKELGLEVNCVCVCACVRVLSRIISGRRTGYIKVIFNVCWTVVKFEYLRMSQIVKISCFKLWEFLLSFGAECFVFHFAR